MNFDQSPFIFLTANPKYVDVLCINCYECVRHEEVDKHSISCSSRAKVKLDESISFDSELKVLNKKLDKLGQALRGRIFEMEMAEDNNIIIELEDDGEDSKTPQTLSDLYSNIYAYNQKILCNNDVRVC